MLLPTLIIFDFSACDDDLRELLPAFPVISHGPDPSKVFRGSKFDEGVLKKFFVEDNRKRCFWLAFGDFERAIILSH